MVSPGELKVEGVSQLEPRVLTRIIHKGNEPGLQALKLGFAPSFSGPNWIHALLSKW